MACIPGSTDHVDCDLSFHFVLMQNRKRKIVTFKLQTAPVLGLYNKIKAVEKNVEYSKSIT